MAVSAQTSDPPKILSNPASQTINAGTGATFTVQASGADPLAYRWRKAGLDLADGGTVYGASTVTLTVSNALKADEGGYSVMVSNAFGSVTSAVAALAVIDPVLTAQPTDQAAPVGAYTTFNVGAAGTQPLGYQWRKDGVALGSATRSSITLWNLQATNSGSYYDVVVTNPCGSVTSVVALLTVNTVDGLNPSVDNMVLAVAPQWDGGIVIGGAFTAVSGWVRKGLARINPDGTLDLGFNPSVSNTVNCLLVQGDGRLLVGGTFTNLAGHPQNYLGRLNADGTLDATFNPDFNGGVNALALQPDGMIVVGGAFTSVAGKASYRLARLNPDGSLDTAFNLGSNGDVYALAVQPDGAILVGGSFSVLGGQVHMALGRVDAAGNIDASFTPAASYTVYCLALQPDGKILAGGLFTQLCNQAHPYVGRLNSDGTLDSTFNPAANRVVYSLALQADGRVLLGGDFSSLTGQSRTCLARLNADGSVDNTFRPDPNNSVRALALQSDGKVLVGGLFTSLAGTSRTRLGRLNNPDPATEALSRDGTTVTWLRGGSSPEVSGVTFYASTNGTDWINLGAASRVDSGWRLAGISVDPGATIRACGIGTGGCSGASGWFIESGLGLPAISLQPQDRSALQGASVTFAATPCGSPSLGCQWYKNGVAVSGATSSRLTLPSVPTSFSGNSYEVVVTNSLGSVRSAPARLWVLGTDSFNPAPNGSVYATAIQADSKILVGGAFTSVGGQARTYLARLDAKGTVDSAFNPGANGSVVCFAVQEDGKIVVGGSFTALAGHNCSYLGRLNPDGSWDTGFAGPLFTSVYGPPVQCLALQPDGKILVGGAFVNLGSQAFSAIARLNTNGSLDTSFTPPTVWSGLGPGPVTFSITVQPDGQILAGGFFPDNPTLCHFVERLDASGNRIARLAALSGSAGSVAVRTSALQPDGRVLLGGNFSWFDGQAHLGLARLNADGSWDASFSNKWANGSVYALSVQADGRILVGGSFTTLNGQGRNCLGRLNPDGTLDASFNLGTTGVGLAVYALALQSDGRILVGGNFTNLASSVRNGLGRLANTGPGGESLIYDGSTITWLRGNATPEVWRTSFDFSMDGTWFSLGEATRVPGAWQVWSWLPGGSLVRARGAVGGHGISTWLVETLSSAPAITSQPASRTNQAGSSVSFNVGSTNAAPLSYQWLKNGLPLRDGGWITGSQRSFLVLNNLLGGDAGAYSVIVGNSFGSVTSSVVSLTVTGDPWITAQPASQTNNAGAKATFRITAAGTLPLSYQWRKDGFALADGGNLSGCRSSLLTLDNLQASNGGAYSVVVTNSYGVATSTVATLTVTIPPPTILVGDGSMGFQAGHFGFNLVGVAGQTVVIEVSTNLISWTGQVTNTFGPGPLHYSDLDPPTLPRRFYRARLQ